VIGIARPESSERRWIGPAAAWSVAVSGLVVWTVATPAETLRTQLTVLQFWSLEACVFLGVGAAVVVLRDLVRRLDRRDVVAAASVATLAVALTVGVAPRTNRIFYDEQIYQNVGQNLADLRRAQLCNDGVLVDGRLRCVSGEYNKQPYAYPHLLSVAYRMFGVSTTPAFVINALAMGLTVAALYLLVLVLFSDRIAALFAALLLAFTPEQIAWSATAAVEPSAALACVAALLAAACFVRWRRTAALVGTAIAAAYAIQFRPESLLIACVVVLLVWQRAPEEFGRTRFWWAGLLFIALAAVHSAHLAAVRHEPWGTMHDRLSVAYVVNNVRVNAGFFVWDARFPMTCTLLAIAGATARRVAPGRLTLLAYFALFFGIALPFYAGSYDYGADVRYSLATYPPIMVLAGLGTARFVQWLDGRVPRVVAVVAIALAIAAQFVAGYLPVVRSTTDGAWAARADVAFARSLVGDLRGNTYVLTHNPGMFQVWGISAGQMSLAATNPAFLYDLAARFRGGVYLHWNFWCNVPDPVQHAFCTNVLALGHGENVREFRERDQHFVLYRLTAGP
jgi:Dolichyl-phosphate-mannose-protein mannosyltransferase